MNKKLIGSYYPYCNSRQTTFNKRNSLDGEFIVVDGNLIYNRTILMLFKIKSNSISIPLESIEKVETINLNGIMPFGVCVFTKNNEEYMFGHINNKKLKKRG